MTLLWFVTAAALALALVALRRARAAARRLDQLTQMYWELKYQHGELRVKLQQTTGEHSPADDVGREPPGGFIPLSSLKR